MDITIKPGVKGNLPTTCGFNVLISDECGVYEEVYVDCLFDWETSGIYRYEDCIKAAISVYVKQLMSSAANIGAPGFSAKSLKRFLEKDEE